MHTDSMNTFACFLCTTCGDIFNTLGYIPRNRISRSYDDFCFNFFFFLILERSREWGKGPEGERDRERERERENFKQDLQSACSPTWGSVSQHWDHDLR